MHFQRRAKSVVNVPKLRVGYGKHAFLENAFVDARRVVNGLSRELQAC
jgi:hypothetical protein